MPAQSPTTIMQPTDLPVRFHNIQRLEPEIAKLKAAIATLEARQSELATPIPEPDPTATGPAEFVREVARVDAQRASRAAALQGVEGELATQRRTLSRLEGDLQEWVENRDRYLEVTAKALSLNARLEELEADLKESVAELKKLGLSAAFAGSPFLKIICKEQHTSCQLPRFRVADTQGMVYLGYPTELAFRQIAKPRRGLRA